MTHTDSRSLVMLQMQIIFPGGGCWPPIRELLTAESPGTLSSEPDGDESQDTDVTCS